MKSIPKLPKNLGLCPKPKQFGFGLWVNKQIRRECMDANLNEFRNDIEIIKVDLDFFRNLWIFGNSIEYVIFYPNAIMIRKLKKIKHTHLNDIKSKFILFVL